MVKSTKTSMPDASSVYDASGMRVAEKVNDAWRYLVYDIGGKLIAEYDGMDQALGVETIIDSRRRRTIPIHLWAKCRQS